MSRSTVKCSLECKIPSHFSVELSAEQHCIQWFSRCTLWHELVLGFLLKLESCRLFRGGVSLSHLSRSSLTFPRHPRWLSTYLESQAGLGSCPWAFVQSMMVPCLWSAGAHSTEGWAGISCPCRSENHGDSCYLKPHRNKYLWSLRQDRDAIHRLLFFHLMAARVIPGFPNWLHHNFGDFVVSMTTPVSVASSSPVRFLGTMWKPVHFSRDSLHPECSQASTSRSLPWWHLGALQETP